MDNNDALTDTDSDGLTDTYELERRSGGTALSPIIADSDGDGLADGREIELGSDPAIADSDNDGLADTVELTGWDVTINSQTPFTIRVTSDPTLADGDGDGLRDQAERALAADPVAANRIDKQNRPYHPNVFNTPPVAIFLATNDYDGFIKPGQSFLYTSTVVAYQAMAPGVLNVTAPNIVGGSPNPSALGFDPLTFSGSQTVTQQTNFAVAGNATTSGIALTSTVNTRLPNSGTAGWSWEAVAEELLPAVATGRQVRDTAVAVARTDRQDSYLFNAQIINPNPITGTLVPTESLGHFRGDLLAYNVPSGVTRQLDVDTDALNTAYTPPELDNAFLRGKTKPSVACNNAGQCMVVWEHLDYCNTLTINSITVVTAGADPGGIEPLIYLTRDPTDQQPRDGGYEQLWDALNNGGNDMFSGTSRGPNANGFPITREFCGATNIHVSEVDGTLSTGRVEAYVDGAGVIGVVGTPNLALNAVADLRIGKSRTNTLPLRAAIDHLQIYSVALAQDAIQAIFSRTDQGYCVAGGAKSDLTRIAWTRLKLTQQDTRGGRITVSNGLPLIIDSNAPTSALTTLANGAKIQGNATTIIGGAASDPTSGIAFVEISVNNGPWQLAEGAETWTFALTATDGAVNIRTRATDRAGNLGAASTAISVVADGNAPQVTLNAPASTVVPTKNAAGQWQVTLTGTATDAGSGIKADSVEVLLQQQSGVGPINNWQTATLTGNNWTINYAFPAELEDPTGAYDVQVRAIDKVDNRTADNAATGLVRLDSSAPVASLSVVDATRQVISQTLTISGLVTDTNSIAGIDKVEIAFTPIQQVAALPANLTGDAAEALLNRTWYPVMLAQRGAGQATSGWTFQLPANLENQYQIDLRATDMLGNRAVGGYAWRGLIDTLDPRVSMIATATGATYFDAASNQQMHEIRFVCAASDRHLTEERFVCPGNALQPPVRSFTDDPSLQTLFPDMTIRSGLANTYTRWLSTTTPVASVSACDIFGRCAQATSRPEGTRSVAGTSGAELVEAAAAAPGAPTAVIVNPTAGSFVAVGNAVSVTVAAEAGAKLKEVTIKLDNTVVQTLSFEQSAAVTRTLRTVNVPLASEGPHTLVAQATAWDNASQTTLYPLTFVADQAEPSLTIDASALTIADTWQPESGILRFNGTASDSVGLAAVQIREGDNGFTDAEFGNGTWQIALPVADPEGRTLAITVRAIDRAGRITEVAQAINTELSAADAPDTTISSGPANPSAVNTAQLVFSGSASGVVFDCQIDNGAYTPCVSPTSYSDLSKGSHTFRVRAIDSRGFTDLSPAEFTWTVNAGQPDATIAGKPANPTVERTASFTFTGDATATASSAVWMAAPTLPAPAQKCTAAWAMVNIPSWCALATAPTQPVRRIAISGRCSMRHR